MEASEISPNPVLRLLLERHSTPAVDLAEPAPEGEALRNILRAAMSAPDHGGLRPWRFVIVRGDARQRLGEVFENALKQRQPDATQAELDKQRSKPGRAPLMVVVIVSFVDDNPKVPRHEQLLSAGCAAEHMQLAAQSMGFGSIWLTGPAASDWTVAEALGLDLDEQIVGFVYFGTPRSPAAGKARPDPDEFVSEWTEPQTLDTL